MPKLLKYMIFIFIIIVIYGFYEKNRREGLYKDFRNDKTILCDNIIVQKSQGWRIHNNKFFTNGKSIKTVIFCKRIK